MERRIIHIDQDRCSGCGACAAACHEGAIAMVNGKAQLMREDYCDGLGDCLPACPAGAITFEVRQALAYDAAAVAAAKAAHDTPSAAPAAPKGCPGAQARAVRQEAVLGIQAGRDTCSCLSHWPVQLKLAPIRAPYFDGAHLLVAADCAAFARADFHARYMQGKVTLIGCPKLDGVDYAEKLGAILAQNAVASVTVVRMEVPCCGGLEHAVARAVQASGRPLAYSTVTLSVDGRVLAE